MMTAISTTPLMSGVGMVKWTTVVCELVVVPVTVAESGWSIGLGIAPADQPQGMRGPSRLRAHAVTRVRVAGSPISTRDPVRAVRRTTYPQGRAAVAG